MVKAFTNNEVYVMVSRSGMILITTIAGSKLACEKKFNDGFPSFPGIKMRSAIVVPNTPANRKKLGVKRG